MQAMEQLSGRVKVPAVVMLVAAETKGKPRIGIQVKTPSWRTSEEVLYAQYVQYSKHPRRKTRRRMSTHSQAFSRMFYSRRLYSNYSGR